MAEWSAEIKVDAALARRLLAGQFPELELESVEHIGEGCLGPVPFRRLFCDRRFRELPILIETEKSRGYSRPQSIALDPLDARNLNRLKSLRDECEPGAAAEPPAPRAPTGATAPRR